MHRVKQIESPLNCLIVCQLPSIIFSNKQHGQHTQHQTHDQQCHIQPVVTITTHHKALDSASHIHTGLSQPASSIFHRDHLFAKIVCLLYGFFPRLQRVLRKVHRRFGFPSQKFLRILKNHIGIIVPRRPKVKPLHKKLKISKNTKCLPKKRTSLRGRSPWQSRNVS